MRLSYSIVIRNGHNPVKIMIPRGFVALKIVLLTAIATNGQTNPFFICQRHRETMDTYVVTINQRDEIVINNCTSSLINDIISRIYRTNLRGRPLRVDMALVQLNQTHLENLTNLDISENDLVEINLENFEHLKYLNLTSNKLPSMDAVSLRRNITLKSLDMSRNRLLKLEHRSIPQTERLYLRSNNIFELDRHIILPGSLLELDLTRNEIENISVNSFVSKNLKILNLSVNLINAVSKTTFEHLPSLEILILQCNKIFEIESGTFSQNVKLVELSIRDNNLSVLKKGVFDDLINLQALDISKNGLLQLTPDTVQNLNNLVHFSLSENLKLCTTECKRDLEFLLVLGGRLKVLKMNRLRLRHFPVTLTTSIRHLDLSRNKLTSIQLGDLENFPFLEILTLDGNEIEATEKDVFSRMEYLKELYLNDNRLKQIPSGLPVSLRVLHLNGNRIIEINKNDFNNLINLKVLKLNSNSIRGVESGAFKFLNHLEILDISDNPILQLSTDAFEGPGKLKVLYASNLKNVNINVTDLRYFPISEMPNLRHLNLSRSPQMVKSFLTDVPLLTTVKQLEILDLSYANLTEVPRRLESFLPRLKRLVLIANPVNCSDLWWWEWREPHTSERRENVTENTNVTIRIVKRPVQLSSSRVLIESRCPMPVANYTIISSKQFWRSLDSSINSTIASSILSSTDTQQPMKSTLENRTSFIVEHGTAFMTAHNTTAVYNVSELSTYSGKNAIKSTAKRKKLNLRSLNAITERANTTWLPVNGSSESSSTDQSESPQSARAKLLESSSWTSNATSSPSLNVTGVEKKVVEISPQLTLTSFDTKAQSTTNEALIYRNTRLHSKNETTVGNSFSIPKITKEEALTRTVLPQSISKHIRRHTESTLDTETSSQQTSYSSIANTSTRISKLYQEFDVHALPAAKTQYDEFQRNRTEDHASFFDWFPASNHSSDLAERIAALNDADVEYTHPGLVIFSGISCLLVVAFISLIIPSCVQKYRWTRHRYRTSEFDNECQRSIEISSISAFVETDITLD